MKENRFKLQTAEVIRKKWNNYRKLESTDGSVCETILQTIQIGYTQELQTATKDLDPTFDENDAEILD
jgi:hypothetical protein